MGHITRSYRTLYKEEVWEADRKKIWEDKLPQLPDLRPSKVLREAEKRVMGECGGQVICVAPAVIQTKRHAK